MKKLFGYALVSLLTLSAAFTTLSSVSAQAQVACPCGACACESGCSC